VRDDIIVAGSRDLTDNDLGHNLAYSIMKGVAATQHFSALVLHMFNHQSSHRGQVTVLLSQAGLDVGVTDLVALIPHESGWWLASDGRTIAGGRKQKDPVFSGSLVCFIGCSIGHLAEFSRRYARVTRAGS